jgi:hypothetical protein
MALGFGLVSFYIRCCGWTYTKREGVAVLCYRKLEDVIDKFAPDSTAANLAKNFNAMFDMLYEVLSRDDLKNIYTGKSAVLFIARHSFISKLHNYCQGFQMALIIITRFFLDHVSHHHGDTKYWMKVIFQPCLRHKDFLQCCQNCHMLFDKDIGNLELAKRLLTHHVDCMRDEVN